MKLRSILGKIKGILIKETPIPELAYEIMPTSILSKDSHIGDYTYIGHNCSITKTIIGRYCCIANNVSIGQGEHDLDRIAVHSMFYEEAYDTLTKLDCTLEDDVWVGVDSIIRRGVRLGFGSVVGANSFVNKDVPPFAIVAGNPAKIIKYRFTETQQKYILNSKWWKLNKEEAAIKLKQMETEIKIL